MGSVRLTRRSEATVKKWVNDVLRDHVANGVAWCITPEAGLFSQDGTPDFVGHICGHPFAVETKRDKNESTRSNQNSSLTRHAAAGGNAFIVCDRHSLNVFAAWCTSIGNCPKRPVAALPNSRIRLSVNLQRG